MRQKRKLKYVDCLMPLGAGDDTLLPLGGDLGLLPLGEGDDLLRPIGEMSDALLPVRPPGRGGGSENFIGSTTVTGPTLHTQNLKFVQRKPTN